MLEPGATVDIDGSAGGGGRLPEEIQPSEAAQPAGLRKSGGFCGAELPIPSSGRASPSLRWGWTKNKQKHKLNHVPRLTHGLDQKSEPGHTVADGDTGQAGAFPKRVVSDVDNAIGNHDVGQAAIRERAVSDAGNTAGNCDTGQGGTVIERIASDAGNTIGDGDAGQAVAVGERIAPDIGNAVGNRDIRQACPVFERIIPDTGNAIGYCDAVQAATRERFAPDVGNAVGNCIATGKTRRKFDERGLTLIEQDSSHTRIGRIICFNHYCSQAGAVTERVVSDVDNAIGNHDVGQAAIRERAVSDAGDVRAYCNISQSGA